MELTQITAGVPLLPLYPSLYQGLSLYLSLSFSLSLSLSLCLSLSLMTASKSWLRVPRWNPLHYIMGATATLISVTVSGPLVSFCHYQQMTIALKVCCRIITGLQIWLEGAIWL